MLIETISSIKTSAKAMVCAFVSVLVMTGCDISKEASTASSSAVPPTAMAPASVDPSEQKFTCPGVADTSVKAVVGKDVVFTTITNREHGGVRHLECWGEVSDKNGLTGVFYSQFGRMLSDWDVWSFSRSYAGPHEESFVVQGVQGAVGELRTGDDGGGSAVVKCGDSFVLVTMYPFTPFQGDLKMNLINLAESMTPWACNGETIPGLGMSLSPALPAEESGSASTPSESQGSETLPS